MTRKAKVGIILLVALLCALPLGLVAFCVVNKVYHTPSRAMSPTLEPGDHLFVDRLAYASAEPERWDVIVFRYPVDPSRDYIKRIVGLPGESVRIRDGDVYVGGGVIRKPWPVQEALWRPVPGSGAAQAWRAEAEGIWHLADGVFEVDCRDSQTPQLLRYRREIVAYNTDDLRRMKLPMMRIPTCDAMVGCLLEPRAKGGSVLIAFDTMPESGIQSIDQWLIRLPLPGEDGPPELRRSESVVATGQPCGLAVGKPSRLEVCHVDLAIIVRVDDQEVLRHEYQMPPKLQRAYGLTRSVGIDLGCQSGHVVFREPSISVDLHLTNFPYTHGVHKPFALGGGEYFTIGDNNVNSNDSRAWGAVSRNAIVGKATTIFWPPSRRGRIR